MYLSKMVILHSYVKLPEGNLCNSLPVQLGPIQKKEPQLPPLSLPRLPSLNSGMRRNMYNAIGLDVNKDGGNTGNMETLFFFRRKKCQRCLVLRQTQRRRENGFCFLWKHLCHALHPGLRESAHGASQSSSIGNTSATCQMLLSPRIPSGNLT